MDPSENYVSSRPRFAKTGNRKNLPRLFQRKFLQSSGQLNFSSCSSRYYPTVPAHCLTQMRKNKSKLLASRSNLRTGTHLLKGAKRTYFKCSLTMTQNLLKQSEDIVEFYAIYLVGIHTIINCSFKVIQYTIGTSSQNNSGDRISTFFVSHNGHLQTLVNEDM